MATDLKLVVGDTDTISREVMPRPRAAGWLIALDVIQGIGGLGGGLWMLFHPHGITGMPVSWLDSFWFHTYLIPGLVLACALGVAPLVVAYGLWRRPLWRWTRPLVGWTGEHWSWVGAALVAAALILWMVVELTLTPARSPVLQIACSAIAVAMAMLVALPGVRRWYAER